MPFTERATSISSNFEIAASVSFTAGTVVPPSLSF